MNYFTIFELFLTFYTLMFTMMPVVLVKDWRKRGTADGFSSISLVMPMLQMACWYRYGLLTHDSFNIYLNFTQLCISSAFLLCFAYYQPKRRYLILQVITLVSTLYILFSFVDQHKDHEKVDKMSAVAAIAGLLGILGPINDIKRAIDLKHTEYIPASIQYALFGLNLMWLYYAIHVENVYMAKDHDTHEKRLPKKLSEKWNQQKDEYYDKINVLTRKVFPVKIKAAKSSESSALQDIRASMTSTLATRVFSPPNRLPADHPDCPFQEDEQNSSSRKEKPSPAKAATRQSPRSHVSAPTQAKERAKTPIKITISRQRKTFSSSSSETDSDDSTPGQMPISRAPVVGNKPGMSREQIRKRIEYIKEHTIEAPPPDSSSVELSSDSEDDERPSTSTTSIQALLKRPIKTEPKSSSESETDQDPSPESSSIPGITSSTTGEIKTEAGAITEAEADAENSDDEPDVKMEPEVQEPDDIDPVALSGVTDQQVYDHFGVKNKEELYSLPQFKAKNDFKENFEKFRGICFKYLRRTMLALSPKVFNVYELYHVRGLAKAGAFHALYGLAPLWICDGELFGSITGNH